MQTHPDGWMRRFVIVLVLLAAAGCAPGTASTSDPLSPEIPTMADAQHVHHAINYIEFTVTDMDEAKRFYTAAFDWAFTDYGPEYAGIQRPGGEGEGEAGGFSVGEKPGPGGPLVILFSRDLDDTLVRVLAAGGTITAEPFDFPGGRRFHFSDPSGNELAVWAEPSTPATDRD